jgi:signal transduction histidine kinase
LRTSRPVATSAQEEERHRISRELHDQVGQQVTSLALELKAFRNGDQVAAPRLERLQRTVEKLGREIHEVAMRLRPIALDDLGLSAALQSALEEWSSRAGVEVDFHAAGLETGRLPSEAETALYRVVLEALHNVLKHAGARRVSVLTRSIWKTCKC